MQFFVLYRYDGVQLKRAQNGRNAFVFSTKRASSMYSGIRIEIKREIDKE
jgi:hypothetical protein